MRQTWSHVSAEPTSFSVFSQEKTVLHILHTFWFTSFYCRTHIWRKTYPFLKKDDNIRTFFVSVWWQKSLLISVWIRAPRGSRKPWRFWMTDPFEAASWSVCCFIRSHSVNCLAFLLQRTNGFSVYVHLQ